jgi:hypothetical protein
VFNGMYIYLLVGLLYIFCQSCWRRALLNSVYSTMHAWEYHRHGLSRYDGMKA